MISVLIISVSTIVLMLMMIVFFPKLKIKKIEIQTFWLIPIIGVVFLLLFKGIDFSSIIKGLTNNSSINPLKILILFLSMTFLSIVLDELGFFRYLANSALKRAKGSQITLFVTLYILCSILTIFTSNDIIILTFTPFIVFFAKNAKIDPIPYLVAEFIGANTWSMFLMIGNPTNIYLATIFDVSFFTYFTKMFLATIFAGVSSAVLLLIVFRKKLKKPLECEIDEVSITNKPLLIINLSCLVLCIILLSICSYINIEMYLITFVFACIVLVSLIIYVLIEKNREILKSSLKRIPYSIIPFILSMFVIVLALKENNITSNIANMLDNSKPILTYGVVSFSASNLINNIPMSVLFSEIVTNEASMYATVIGSNIGAFLTPIGALAGIMWLSILKKYDVEYNFRSFVKYGVLISIPTLLFALLGLSLII